MYLFVPLFGETALNGLVRHNLASEQKKISEPLPLATAPRCCMVSHQGVYTILDQSARHSEQGPWPEARSAQPHQAAPQATRSPAARLGRLLGQPPGRATIRQPGRMERRFRRTQDRRTTGAKNMDDWQIEQERKWQARREQRDEKKKKESEEKVKRIQERKRRALRSREEMDADRNAQRRRPPTLSAFLRRRAEYMRRNGITPPEDQ